MDDRERERRRQAIEEARATLARVAHEEPDYLKLALARPVESQMDRDRRELANQYRRFEQERERETAPAATPEWESWLRDRLVVERAFVLECVGTALGQALRKERAVSKRELASEVRSLRLELTAADDTISELRQTIGELRRTLDKGSGTGVVLDLPIASRRN